MSQLLNDGNLGRATEVEGYKVLPPCVIYGKIGQGGMGAVYRGRHLNLDIDVAVKCLKPELVGSDEQFVVRFRREARAAAQINHQNVIRVYDVSEDQGLHYLIMELVKGETARERVARKGQLAVGEALEIVYGAALGLAEAHRKGFVHRDIKPDNLMISSAGQVKVADLGLAKPAIREDHASLVSGTNLVMGTPQYMPPEQWESTSAVTSAADVWALGATLYYLLVGGEAIKKDSLPRIMQRILLQPFPDPRRSRPEVPADVAQLIAKMTATAAAERFQDAQELAEAMEGLSTRRQALRDKGAAPTSQVSDQILSPPPATTLAKIKFWLDQQGREQNTQLVTPTPPAGPGGTLVVDAAAQAAIPTVGARDRTAVRWLIAGATMIAVMLVVAFGPWGNNSGPGWLTVADQLEGSGKYEEAVAETNRVHSLHPELPEEQKQARLARIYAAWARDLGARGSWREALVQIERSLAQRDVPATRAQRQDLLQRIGRALDASMVREAPAQAPLVRGSPVEFRGRLDAAVVTALRIAGRAVALSAGTFVQAIDIGGADSVQVEAVLGNGDILTLRSWPITYKADGALAPVTLEVSPEVVVLTDDAPSELVVRTMAGAEVTVDGKPVAADPDATTHRTQVRSALPAPEPVTVIVRRSGFRDATRTVPIQRARSPVAWTREPEAVGAKLLRGKVCVGEAFVRLTGEVAERADEVLVDGAPVQAQWRGGVFTCTASLPGVGTHEVVVELRRKFREPLRKTLAVAVLGDPPLEWVAPARDGETATAATFTVIVRGDQWVTSANVRRGGQLLATTAQPGDDGTCKLDVPLQEGENVLDLEVTNAVGKRTTRRLTIQRSPQAEGAAAVAGKPRILGVFVVDPDGQERAVEPNRTVRVRTGAKLRVVSSASDTTTLLRERCLEEDDLVLRAGAALVDGSSRWGIRVRSEAGTSDPWQFRIVVDDKPPVVQVSAPTGPVGAGAPFTCSGTWEDESGTSSITVNGVAAQGAAASGRGSWTVQLPGIDGPVDYELVVTDRAGNQTRQPLKISP